MAQLLGFIKNFKNQWSVEWKFLEEVVEILGEFEGKFETFNFSKFKEVKKFKFYWNLIIKNFIKLKKSSLEKETNKVWSKRSSNLFLISLKTILISRNIF